jgi:hypothetical protein
MDIPPPEGTLSYFVYYRIRADADRDQALTRIRAMQASLHARTGVRGRLMMRHGDAATWMEVYEAVSDPTGFDAALQQEVAAANVLELIEPGSARHVEPFSACV